MSQLLDHVKFIYQIPIADIYVWTDSTIVLNCLSGCSRKFKTFVGNRIAGIVDVIPPNRLNHVSSRDNPADCASRGLYPSELLNHSLWWKGPDWLKSPKSKWPVLVPPPNDPSDEQSELCLVTTTSLKDPIIPLTHYSSFPRFQRVTDWIMRFAHNCRAGKNSTNRNSFLTAVELSRAENYWLRISQMSHFPQEISVLRTKGNLSTSSPLLLLNPFIDSNGLIRVGGRISKSNLKYDNIHPVILHGHHTINKLLIYHEHHDSSMLVQNYSVLP